MSLTSPDARAVVAAVDRLTTQVRRLADGASTPVVVGEMEAIGTCDASTHGLGAATLGPCILRYQHDGPVHQDETGVRWSTAVAAAHAPTTADDGPGLPEWIVRGTRDLSVPEQTPAAAEDAQRATRREQLHNLLARADRSILTIAEAAALRDLVDAEVRDADTARAVAAGNKRHVQLLYAELEQAQAAIHRVRALATEPGETNHYIARERLLATLDDTDQPEQS